MIPSGYQPQISAYLFIRNSAGWVVSIKNLIISETVFPLETRFCEGNLWNLYQRTVWRIEMLKMRVDRTLSEEIPLVRRIYNWSSGDKRAAAL